MQKEAVKEKIKENYGKIALEGNLNSCCSSQGFCCNKNNISKEQVSGIIG